VRGLAGRVPRPQSAVPGLRSPRAELAPPGHLDRRPRRGGGSDSSPWARASIRRRRPSPPVASAGRAARHILSRHAPKAAPLNADGMACNSSSPGTRHQKRIRPPNVSPCSRKTSQSSRTGSGNVPTPTRAACHGASPWPHRARSHRITGPAVVTSSSALTAPRPPAIGTNTARASPTESRRPSKIGSAPTANSPA